MSHHVEFDQHEWLRLISLAQGERGSFEDEYRAVGGPSITASINHAVGLLRQQRLELATDVLARAEDELEALPPVSPALHHALYRWLTSAQAYLYYRQGDLDGAVELLDRATEHVARAIAADRATLVLALHCYDFRLQHARVAQRRGVWEEMWRHLRLSHRMLKGSKPLCQTQTDDVYVEEVRDLYRPLAEEAQVLDEQLRDRVFNRQVQSIFRLDQVVVPF